MKKLVKKILPVVELLISPLVLLSGVMLLMVRKAGIERMTLSKKIFCLVGVYPLRDHYYEPMFNPVHLQKPLNQDRELPGLDLNEQEQLALLGQFNYLEELRKIPIDPGSDEYGFYYKNPSFTFGDAEYLYSVIRHFKPARIVEIGSGNSTLMAIAAIRANQIEDTAYLCEHICVEPYEMPWLESSGVKVIRNRVEEVDKSIFAQLGKNDILFIDSSHVIRPQGDVLCEFLEILPVLQSGVLVHVHDIFTPKDYLQSWVVDSVRMWNEQYLLEAFLSFNNEYRIIGALNWLTHHHFDAIAMACPILSAHPEAQPGSFWLARN